VADLEQEGGHLEVIFTAEEPDFLYDTGWQAENPAGNASARFSAVVATVLQNPWIMVGLGILLLLPLSPCYWLAGFAALLVGAVIFAAGTSGLALAFTGSLASLLIAALVLLPPARALRGVVQLSVRSLK
jgi:hypothetical protein